MNTVTQNVAPVQAAEFDLLLMGTDCAAQWGFEDATSDEDQNGTMYFQFGSAEWDAYNEAYLRGLEGMENVNPARLAAAQDLVQRATTMAAAPVVWGVRKDVSPC